MRHIFIINPVAGNGKIQHRIANDIHSYLKNKKIKYEIYHTKFKGDIYKFVHDKCKDEIPTVFYACGGDGTLHEVVNCACTYSHVSIGVIPCGSGNDFVKNFDNEEFFHNIKAQVNGKSTSIDLIKTHDEYAISVCNIGFDADAASNMHKFKKIPFITGSGCYILSVFYCLSKKLGKNLKVITDDGFTINKTFLLGVIANGHSYGGGYKCAPEALVNDGIIDLCFISNMSRLRILSLIRSYKAGTHLKNEKLNKYITYKKCKSVKIVSREPINLCIDGENYSKSELDFKIIPKALNFWIPQGVKVQNEELMEKTVITNN